MRSFSEFSIQSGLESLEQRLSLSGLKFVGRLSPVLYSDPTVPVPPSEIPDDPAPPPEPSPGPFPGNDPPVVFPDPPIGGPVGPG